MGRSRHVAVGRVPAWGGCGAVGAQMGPAMHGPHRSTGARNASSLQGHLRSQPAFVPSGCCHGLVALGGQTMVPALPTQQGLVLAPWHLVPCPHGAWGCVQPCRASPVNLPGNQTETRPESGLLYQTWACVCWSHASSVHCARCTACCTHLCDSLWAPFPPPAPSLLLLPVQGCQRGTSLPQVSRGIPGGCGGLTPSSS